MLVGLGASSRITRRELEETEGFATGSGKINPRGNASFVKLVLPEPFARGRVAVRRYPSQIRKRSAALRDLLRLLRVDGLHGKRGNHTVWERRDEEHRCDVARE